METAVTWINHNWPWLGTVIMCLSLWAAVHLIMKLFRDFKDEIRTHNDHRGLPLIR